MRVAGIIAEYNPFHNGHAHQIRQVRALGFDAVVCVMSPGVVQRGSLALMPCRCAHQAALACGADLVLCLPAPYAAASAEAFAAAGVRALGALGCVQALCYGAETPDAAAHLRAAKALVGPAFARAPARRACRRPALCPPARQQAAQAVCEGAGDLLASPNDILGVEYCKAILTQKSALRRWRWRAGARHTARLWAPGRHSRRFPACAPHGGRRVCQRHSVAGPCAAQRHGSAGALCAAAALALYLCAQQQGAVLEEARFSTALLCRLRAGCAQGFGPCARRGRRAGKPAGRRGAGRLARPGSCWNC